MNLKKFSGVVLSCILAGSIFTGCGDDAPKVPKSQIGIITKLNETEQNFNAHSSKLEESVKIPNVNLMHNYHYYKDLNSMIAALESKKIDEICTYRSVANYLVSQNPKLEILPHSIGMQDAFCFAVRKEDTALRDALNSAIKVMQNADKSTQETNTISYIAKTYIAYLNPNDKTPVTDMPKIDGAENIKVGVTGDLPPLDLILEDGTPAGFTTRMLEEISRLTNKNIEIVKIASDERATALTSKKIDVAFWVIVPSKNLEESGKVPENVDVPAELEITAPYYEDEIVHIALKK